MHANVCKTQMSDGDSQVYNPEIGLNPYPGIEICRLELADIRHKRIRTLCKPIAFRFYECWETESTEV